MADAEQEEKWLREAWSVCWTVAAMSGEELVPGEITPYKPKKRAKSQLHIEGESRQAWAALDAFFHQDR